MKDPIDSRRYKIGARKFKLPKLNYHLTNEFIKMHRAECDRKSYDATKLRKAAKTFFDSNKDWKMHDLFFKSFTHTWAECLGQRRDSEGVALWNLALNIADDWGKENLPEKIHKGTPYYYLGGTFIRLENYLIGFSLMHQAFEEDTRIHDDKAIYGPAGCFVSLNSEKAEQYFRPYVQKIAKYLNKKIELYHNYIKGTLSMEVFRDSFLLNPSFLEQVFLFAYLLWNIRRMQQKDMQALRSSFGSILKVETAFGLCLVLDEIVASKDGKRYTSEHLDTLSTSYLQPSRTFSDKARDLNRESGEQGMGFGNAFEAVLDKNFSFSNSNTLSQIEWDFATLHLLRNFGAHNVKSYGIVNKRFDETVQSLLDCIFFAVENILP